MRQQGLDQQARRARDRRVVVQRPLFADGPDSLLDTRRAADVARAKERLQRLAPGALGVLKRWPPLQEISEDGRLLVRKPRKTCGK